MRRDPFVVRVSVRRPENFDPAPNVYVPRGRGRFSDRVINRLRCREIRQRRHERSFVRRRTDKAERARTANGEARRYCPCTRYRSTKDRCRTARRTGGG